MVHHLSSLFHPWVSMILAIAFELVGTINAKSSGGLTVFVPTWTMFLSYIVSVAFLSFALDKTAHVDHGGIDLGIAYATWSGLGTVVATIAGVYLYGEKLITAQYFGIFLTIAGLIIINVSPNYIGNDEEKSNTGRLLMQANDTANRTAGIGTYGAVV